MRGVIRQGIIIRNMKHLKAGLIREKGRLLLRVDDSDKLCDWLSYGWGQLYLSFDWLKRFVSSTRSQCRKGAY